MLVGARRLGRKKRRLGRSGQEAHELGDGDEAVAEVVLSVRAVEAMRILRMRNALDIELFEFAQRLFDRRLASALEAAERARNDTITRQPDNFPANMLTT